MKTGDPISPPGGYKGGGMQMLVDASIDPAGNVWVSNNWQDQVSCYGSPTRAFQRAAAAKGLWCSTAWRSRCARLKSDRRRDIKLAARLVPVKLEQRLTLAMRTREE